MNTKTKIIAVFCVIAVIAVAAVFGYRSYEKRLYPREYVDIVAAAAKKNDIPESLVYSVIRAESSFRAGAV